MYFQFEKRLIHKIERIFVVRKDLIAFYTSKYHNLADKIFFIPNGVDQNVFYPYLPELKIEKKIKFLQQCNFHSKDRLILFVGRLEGQKDPMLLIDVFRYLEGEDESIKLIIVGTGTQEKQMKQKLEMYSLSNKVKFLGVLPQTEVAELMRISDMLLLTSASEGMPMAVLEAQGCGLPVVSTDVGELREIIKGGSSGEIVAQRNPELIAQRVFEIFMNSDRYNISNYTARITFFRAADRLKKVYDAHYSR